MTLTMTNGASGLEHEERELCGRCKSIPATTFFSSGKPRLWYQDKFGPTQPYQLIEGSNAFEELKLSAAAGCGLCKLFEDAFKLSGSDPDEQLRRSPESCQEGIRLQRDSHENLKISFGIRCDYQIDARLVILTEQSTTRSFEPASYVIETESDSPANFDLVRSWLAECCKDHVECRVSLEFELPRRLLDVAMPSSLGIIRLVSTLELPTKGRVDYVALSHCWGSFWPLQTKKDNLPSHVQGIPDSQLPQTFHDAVRTTRKLGLRYLWVDSMCIVQDDPTDFEAECARMNTIFANALCTISASDARDCRDGLFRSRTIKPIRLTYESDGFEPSLTVIMQPAFHRSWIQGLLGPLQSRAWVLQERHLSPRIIHYTKKCLMWECRTAVASEHRQKMQTKAEADYFSWTPRSSDRFLNGKRPTLGPGATESSLRNYTFSTLTDRWYQIVEDYSNRILSRPEDKLPALSGFAAEWKRINPEDDYLAGIWKSEIFKGLTWFPSSASGHIRRRLPESDAPWPPSSPFKGIPSWSWAAFDGPVAHFRKSLFNENLYGCDSPTLKVLGKFSSPNSWSPRLRGVTTTIEELNPFGRVSKGEITVSSWSIVTTLSESEFLPCYLFANGDAPKVYCLHPDLKQPRDGTVYFDHDPFYLPKTQVRFLPLGIGAILRGRMSCICGLALVQLKTDKSTPDKDLYRRVGLFELDDLSFWVSRRERKVITII